MTRKFEEVGTQAFWKQQLELAEKRLEAFEGEAQKVLGELAERGRKSRAEIQDLLRRAGETDLSGRVEEIRAQFEKGSTELLRKLPQLQERALNALGLAGRAQVEDLGARIQKLSKKINRMAKKGSGRTPTAHRPG